jgi:hypothetical protein
LRPLRSSSVTANCAPSRRICWHRAQLRGGAALAAGKPTLPGAIGERVRFVASAAVWLRLPLIDRRGHEGAVAAIGVIQQRPLESRRGPLRALTVVRAGLSDERWIWLGGLVDSSFESYGERVQRGLPSHCPASSASSCRVEGSGDKVEALQSGSLVCATNATRRIDVEDRTD